MSAAAQRMVPRLRLTAAVAVFAAVVGVLGLRAWTLVNVPGAPGHAQWVLQDFRDAVYYPVVALLAGDNPYDVRTYFARYPVGQEFPVYSPLTLLLHLPFGLLPYRLAEALYFASVIGLTVVLAAVSLRLAGVAARADAVLGLAAALLLSRPGQSNLLLGQVTVPAVLATLAALHWSSRRRWWATAALALATFKPTFGLPLALLLACRGDRRVAVGGVAIGGALAALLAVWPMSAAGGPGPFVAALLDNQATTRGSLLFAPLTSWLRVDVWALAARLAGGTTGPVSEALLSLAVLGATGLLLRRLRRVAAALADPLAVGLVGAGLLAGVYHQVYDLLLLAPAALAVVLGRPAALWQERPWARAVLAAASLALFGNYATSNAALRHLGVAGGWWLALVSVNAVLLLLVWGLHGAVALRLPVAHPAPAARRVWTRGRIGALR
jgi:hypothetical protein